MANRTWLVLTRALLIFSLVLNVNAAIKPDALRVMGPQGVNLWKLERAREQELSSSSGRGASVRKDPGLVVQDPSVSLFAGDEEKMEKDYEAEFPGKWFRQPLDHFDKSNTKHWRQRYWVSKRHYKKGSKGPVIVLDGGETSGSDRLAFLDTGIVEILAQATGGVGVILEHRYYGRSLPVNNFSTDSLRWLTNEQAAADSANFMANVKFDGIDEDLTAPGTPWIYYGGSYAGARAAHMRVLYPELVYGSIASSAVTHAALSNWEYMEIIRNAAEPKCSKHIENTVKTVDAILEYGKFTKSLKKLFGVADLEHNDDFVSLLTSPLGSWQAKCWDPEVGSTTFDDFCETLGKPFGRISATAAGELPYGNQERLVQVEGAEGLALDFAVLNYAKWVRENVVSRCPEGFTTEECFGSYDDARYQEITLDQDWRLWMFQVCTQWGYFTTAPPDMKQPRIISRLLTLAYESKICKQAFPPGEHMVVPTFPNVTAVNALGDFDIAADRLAIIDGEVDPWRPDTPHGSQAEDREDTILRPFKLIPDAVHHYDEYGLRNLLDEPPEIKKIHREMITFVLEWLKDWTPPKKD
ncbi:serine carboxypeptidase S28-domain-containing protein [Cyathus striatus]|nr:serine carboxypeptidase S28-domain-containing protein [Cyathus striatus]